MHGKFANMDCAIAQSNEEEDEGGERRTERSAERRERSAERRRRRTERRRRRTEAIAFAETKNMRSS